MASITPYKDGFRAVVRRVGYKARTKIFPTKRQAQTWARSVEKEIDEGRYKDPAAGLKTTTVGELFEKFRDEVAPHRKGARWEVVRLNRFLREVEFMPRRLDQFTSTDIREWRDARLKEVSKESVRREMNLMGSVFSYAIKEWDVGLRDNPMSLVQRPSSNAKGRERRWSDTEIEAVLKASGWHDKL